MGNTCGKGADMPKSDAPGELPSPVIDQHMDVDAAHAALFEKMGGKSPEWDPGDVAAVRPSEMSTGTSEEGDTAGRDTAAGTGRVLGAVLESSPLASSSSSRQTSDDEAEPQSSAPRIVPLGQTRSRGAPMVMRRMSSDTSSVDEEGPAPHHEQGPSLGSTTDWKTVRASVISIDNQTSLESEIGAEDKDGPRQSEAAAPPTKGMPMPLAPSFVRKAPGPEAGPGVAKPHAPPDRTPPQPEAAKKAGLGLQGKGPPPSKPPPQPQPSVKQRASLGDGAKPHRPLMKGFSSRTPSPHFRHLSVPNMGGEGATAPLNRRLLSSIPPSPSARNAAGKSPSQAAVLLSAGQPRDRRSSEPYQMPALTLSPAHPGLLRGGLPGGSSHSSGSDDSSLDPSEDDNEDLRRQSLRKPIVRHRADVSMTAAWVTQRLDDILDHKTPSDDEAEDEESLRRNRAGSLASLLSVSEEDKTTGNDAAKDVAELAGSVGSALDVMDELDNEADGDSEADESDEAEDEAWDDKPAVIDKPAATSKSGANAEGSATAPGDGAGEGLGTGLKSWVSHRLGDFLSNDSSAASSGISDGDNSLPSALGKEDDWVTQRASGLPAPAASSDSDDEDPEDKVGPAPRRLQSHDWTTQRMSTILQREDSQASSNVEDDEAGPAPSGLQGQDWTTQRMSTILQHQDSQASSLAEGDEAGLSPSGHPSDLQGQDWTTQRMSTVLPHQDSQASSHGSGSDGVPTPRGETPSGPSFLERSKVRQESRRRTLEPSASLPPIEDKILMEEEPASPARSQSSRPSLPGLPDAEGRAASEGGASRAPRSPEGPEPPAPPLDRSASAEGNTFASFLSTVSRLLPGTPKGDEVAPTVGPSSTPRLVSRKGTRGKNTLRRARLEPNPVLGVDEEPLPSPPKPSATTRKTPGEGHPKGSVAEFYAFLDAFCEARAANAEIWTQVQGDARSVFDHTMDRDRTRRRGGALNGDMRQQNIAGETATSLREVYSAAEHGRYVFRKLLRMCIEEVMSESKTRGGRGNIRKRSFKWSAELVAPLKDRARAQEKAETEYGAREPGPGVAWLYDVLRGYVVCDTMEEMKRMVEKLEIYAQESGGEIVRVKNRLFTPCPTGFRDILVSIRLPVPKPTAEVNPVDSSLDVFYMVAEVQVELRAFKTVSDARRTDAIFAYFRDFFRGCSNGRLLQHHVLVLQRLRKDWRARKPLSATATEMTTMNSPTSYDELLLVFELFRKIQSWDAALVVAVRLLAMTVSDARVHLNPRKSGAVAASVSRIADVLMDMGELDAALEKKGEALDIMHAACGTEEHANVLSIMNGIGQCLTLQKRHREAVVTFKKEIDTRRRLLGPLDPSTAGALGDIAQVYVEMRQYRAALDDYHEALEIRREAVGEGSLATAKTLNDMGLTLTLLGRFQEAFMRHEEAARIFEGELTSSHPSTICSRIAMARSLHSQERYADALAECGPVLRLAGLPEPDARLARYFAMVKGHSAELLGLLGRTEEAKDRFIDAVASLRATTPPSVVATPTSPRSSRRYREASYVSGFGIRVHSTASMGILSTGLGLGLGLGCDAALMEALDGLATLYQYELEAYDEAMELHREVCALRQARFGNRHPDVAQTLTNMANLYQLMGEEAKALPLYREALAIYQEALEDGDPLVGITSYNLAILLHDSMDEQSEGRDLAELALGIFLREGGQEHPYTMMAQETLESWDAEA